MWLRAATGTASTTACSVRAASDDIPNRTHVGEAAVCGLADFRLADIGDFDQNEMCCRLGSALRDGVMNYDFIPDNTATCKKCGIFGAINCEYVLFRKNQIVPQIYGADCFFVTTL